MSTAELVLGLLRGGAAHGYEVKRGHDAWFPDVRPLAFGQVYTTLARLERDGLVEVIGKGSDGGPERTMYELTDAGRAHLEAWLNEPVEPSGGTAAELVRKVIAAIRTGADAAGFVARQRAIHLRRIRELKEAPGGDDPAVRLVRDHVVAHLDADLRWLEAALDRTTMEAHR